jgi:hypothetical protein
MTDKEAYEFSRKVGIPLEWMFIAGGRVFLSEDGGHFDQHSTYRPLDAKAKSQEAELLAFLKRTAAPEFASIDEVAKFIAGYRLWEILYDELGKVVDRHNEKSVTNSRNYLLVEDCYAAAQHKVECEIEEPTLSEFMHDVQDVLRRHKEEIEVIVVTPGTTDDNLAYSVYSDRVLHRQGNSRFGR